MWGIDIVGPFPIASGQVKFLLVVIDYFTEWIEAEPLASITAKHVQRFLWKNLVCKYGIPVAIISNNGKQFADKSLQEFCVNLGIKRKFFSVEHPQSNGQVEAANKVILGELKKILGQVKGMWVEELPSILWAYHYTLQSTTQETPFRLTYGVDVMITVELGETSLRRQCYHPKTNEDNIRLELDLVEDVREVTRFKEE